MVLSSDCLFPFRQPNLGFKQEEIISELYPLTWNHKKNYVDWLRMRRVLDNERRKGRRLEAQAQRQLAEQRDQPQQPQPPQAPQAPNPQSH